MLILCECGIIRGIDYVVFKVFVYVMNVVYDFGFKVSFVLIIVLCVIRVVSLFLFMLLVFVGCLGIIKYFVLVVEF